MSSLEKIARIKSGLHQVIEEGLIPLQQEGELDRYTLLLQDGEPYLTNKAVSLTIDISWGDGDSEFYNQIYISADLESDDIQVRRYIAACYWEDELPPENLFNWNKAVLPYRSSFFRREHKLIFMKHYRNPDNILPNFFRWIRLVTKALSDNSTRE